MLPGADVQRVADRERLPVRMRGNICTPIMVPRLNLRPQRSHQPLTSEARADSVPEARVGSVDSGPCVSVTGSPRGWGEHVDDLARLEDSDNVIDRTGDDMAVTRTELAVENRRWDISSAAGPLAARDCVAGLSMGGWRKGTSFPAA